MIISAINARNNSSKIKAIVTSPYAKYLFPLVNPQIIPPMNDTGQIRKPKRTRMSGPPRISKLVNMKIAYIPHVTIGYTIKPIANHAQLGRPPVLVRSLLEPRTPSLPILKDETSPLSRVPLDSDNLVVR